jgi:hypothetical protein
MTLPIREVGRYGDTHSVHLATEDLLREVMDYLLRLPAHPMTVAIAKKVKHHLESPGTVVARKEAALLSAARQADRMNRSGITIYTAEGVPELVVSVGPEAAHVSSPAAAIYGGTSQGRKFAQQLVVQLARGVTVELGPRVLGLQPEAKTLKP